MTQGEIFRAIIQSNKILILPGIYDCLSAKIAERCGFEALFTSGFGISAATFGKPDYGLVSGSEMLAAIQRIAGSVNIPLIADIDTGYGNYLNVIETINTVKDFGVAGVIIEDQLWPKRCGHFEGKQVVSTQESIEKLKAAVYARADSKLVIIARTDSRAVLGLKEAIERGHKFIEAGADILFIEAPESIEELEQISNEFRGTTLFANMVEGGKTPILSAEELGELGFKIVVYPVSGLFSSAFALHDCFKNLRENKSTTKFNNMINFKEFEEIIDLEKYKNLMNSIK